MTVKTESDNNDMSGSQWIKKLNSYKGSCSRVMITIWIAAAQFWQIFDLFHVHERWISGLLMRRINARLAPGSRIRGQITRTLDADTFSCLLRFFGRCCAFTTGASQQLVMTQYPRSLKQFSLFLLYFQVCGCLVSCDAAAVYYYFLMWFCFPFSGL